eukprot:scaffold3948_cov309-Prasinococcus_capsulatus_cf.AAC.2
MLREQEATDLPRKPARTKQRSFVELTPCHIRGRELAAHAQPSYRYGHSHEGTECVTGRDSSRLAGEAAPAVARRSSSCRFL